MRTIVTSALPYSYAVPHLGNFVGSVLPGDVYFKYLKMKGEDAIFICGSDQHGTPVELKAIKEGRTPEEVADEMHERIKSLFARMGCGFTYYGKTHCEANRRTVYEIFDRLYKNGFIAENESRHAYCNFDRRFLVDRLIVGTCPYCSTEFARGDQCDNCGRLLEPKDIINPKCSICGKEEIVFRDVRNLALSLDKLQARIRSFITEREGNNWTKNAINKPLSYIDEGLKPRDITRSMNWGFQVPLKGFEDRVFYVWFDAVIGYIGITREWDERRWLHYWKGDARLVHFLGKDNIEFHTLMWPGIIIGSDMGYVLPATIKASEYLVSKTVKFSKSRGVGLNLETALDIMGSDYWRFALMYLYPETSDTEFSIELLEEVVNTIMNDKIGNFIQRVVKFSIANKDAIGGEPEKRHSDEAARILSAYTEGFEKVNLREALRQVVEMAGLGNAIMSNSRPWEMAKNQDKAKELGSVLNTLIEISYYLSIMLWPFAPDASVQALGYFGIEGDPTFKLLDKDISLDFDAFPEPIFKKIGNGEIEKLKLMS